MLSSSVPQIARFGPELNVLLSRLGECNPIWLVRSGSNDNGTNLPLGV